MLAGSIADTNLNTITTGNKVSGSAVQLQSNKGLENSSGLGVKVDNSSIEIHTDGSLRVKSGGVTNSKLANSSITFSPSGNITINGGNTDVAISLGDTVSITDGTSDVRLKKDITQLNSGLDKILSLNPVNFRWKKNDERNNIGLIAQEVEEVIPESVFENNDIKSISYNMITATLVKGMQELKSENDTLKAENTLLKEQINNILSRLNKAGI